MKNNLLLLNIFLLSSAAHAMQQLTDEQKKQITKDYTGNLRWVYVVHRQIKIDYATSASKINKELAADLDYVSGGINVGLPDETVQEKLDALSTKWGLDRFDLNAIKNKKK